jgi:hypothetical protein
MWNSNIIDSCFISSEGDLIKQIPLIMDSMEDQLMWPHSKDGSYTVKTGYNLLKHWADVARPCSTNPNTQSNHWKKLWSLNTIPRHKALLWRVIQKAIPVKTALNKRGLPCNTLCPRCLEKEETIEHAFIHCTHSSKIWFGSKLDIRFDQSHQSFSDWVIHALNSLREEDLRHVAAITYGIWFARNQWVFNQRDIEDTEVITKANTSIQDYIQATTSTSELQINTRKSTTSNHQRPSSTNRNRQWQKPANGVIKVNSDANLARAGRWGCGATYRDSTGALVAAATWELPGPTDATLAEVYAVNNVISLAKDCGFHNVQIESDCESAIAFILDTDYNPRSYVGDVIRSIRNIRAQFRNCSFRHIHREANRAAHLLAGVAHVELNQVWIDEIPPQIVTTLIRDSIH